MKSKFALFFSLSLAAALASCGRVQIGRILSDPAHFQHRIVNVNGTVTRASGTPAEGALYEIGDETGRIYVLSHGGAPSKGAHVRVTGKVVEGLKLMGRPFKAVIQEREHKLR